MAEKSLKKDKGLEKSIIRYNEPNFADTSSAYTGISEKPSTIGDINTDQAIITLPDGDIVSIEDLDD